MKEIFVEREVGGRMLRFETGKVAKLASGAIIARYGESAVLCTAMRADPRPGLDFFPLQCDYREKLTASGKFPGGFRKREGAPGEKEVLTMRMIDRPIRPLFPDGFIDEVQLQCWVMSHDGQNDTDVLACTGASAALCCTDAPSRVPWPRSASDASSLKAASSSCSTPRRPRWSTPIWTWCFQVTPTVST